MLEEATKKDLIDGDLKGAIEIYQKILSFDGVPRAVAAKALLQLGQCHEKLGNAEARKTYERLVREFADQPEEAKAARGRLAALGGRDSAMRVRHVWSGDLLGAPTSDGRYLTSRMGERGSGGARPRHGPETAAYKQRPTVPRVRSALRALA